MQTLAAEDVLERMVRAVENVRDRLLRATAALDTAGVPYAVIGGNAVAVWVARVDRAAVRNTQDVDILLRRPDLPAARAALEAVGFVYRHSAGIDMFLDGADAKARDAVHVLFAREKVRRDYAEAAPDIEPHDLAPPFRVLALESLVRMKLTSNRDKDRTHIRDLIGVDLIDDTWIDRLQPELAERLRNILDNPDG
ncbi:MAG TPA: hypothetical protein VHR66_27595 [Gemmataceae bacterium]|nr:hypothetical protein [Gemmataceae bacterium]